MKKASIETLLLLSNIQNKTQMAQFCRDLKALDVDLLDDLLSKLESYKQRSYAAASEAFEAQLEQQKSQAEADRSEKEDIKRSADEVLHLLLKRSKLKVPQAANQLGEQLTLKGYAASFDGEANKSGFAKWVKQLCKQYPKGEIVKAAVDLSAKYG